MNGLDPGKLRQERVIIITEIQYWFGVELAEISRSPPCHRLSIIHQQTGAPVQPVSERC